MRPALFFAVSLVLSWAFPLRAAYAEPSVLSQSPLSYGIAMYGRPALPPGFDHFPYVNPEAPKGGRLVLGVQGSFDSLNPLIVRGNAPDAVSKYVLQSLMTRSLDEPFTVYGLVAQTVEIPDDRTFAVFHLDPRARFSDGHPLTADDVVASFDLLRTRGKPFYRSAFSKVTRAEAQGDATVRFEFGDGSDRELPLLIALMPIFAHHATDAGHFEETSLTPPVGSGPYRISEVVPGEHITLTRNPNFWASDLPVMRGLYNVDEIRYDFYRDANGLFEAFKTGNIDVRIETDPTRWTTGYDFPALQEGRITRETVPIRLPKPLNAFVFNIRRPELGDARVREALSLLFDVDWAIKNLYAGAYQRTQSVFESKDLSSIGAPPSPLERALLERFPESVRPDILEGRWHPSAPDGTGRDRTQAKRALALMATAGYRLADGVLVNTATHTPLKISFMATSRAQERLALNYASALARIGVEMTIRLVDDVQYWRRLSAFDFDMIQFTWSATPSPGAEQMNRWSSVAAGRQGSLNYAGVASPAVDAILTVMANAPNREAFVDYVRALDRVLLSGFYVIPLFHASDAWLAYNSRFAHPQTIPLFGITPETWWRTNP